jgi:hypothetical protein
LAGHAGVVVGSRRGGRRDPSALHRHSLGDVRSWRDARVGGPRPVRSARRCGGLLHLFVPADEHQGFSIRCNGRVRSAGDVRHGGLCEDALVDECAQACNECKRAKCRSHRATAGDHRESGSANWVGRGECCRLAPRDEIPLAEREVYTSFGRKLRDKLADIQLWGQRDADRDDAGIAASPWGRFAAGNRRCAAGSLQSARNRRWHCEQCALLSCSHYRLVEGEVIKWCCLRCRSHRLVRARV